MPKFSGDLVKYVQTFLERTYERCRTSYMEARMFLFSLSIWHGTAMCTFFNCIISALFCVFLWFCLAFTNQSYEWVNCVIFFVVLAFVAKCFITTFLGDVKLTLHKWARGPSTQTPMTHMQHPKIDILVVCNNSHITLK